MKSNCLYIFLLSIFFFSCNRDLQIIDVYDGKQSLEFQFNVNPNQILEGMEAVEAMSPKVYKIYLFKDNRYSNTLTVHDENSMEQIEGGYSYLAVGAEDESVIPALNLVEGESSMNDAFLDLSEEGNVKDVPNIVVASGNFTMGSTINTVKMDFNPLGCEYIFNCRNLSQHGVKKIKLVIKGGASGYNFNLKPVNNKNVETVMTAAGVDEEGWISIATDDFLCSAKILLMDNSSLKLGVSFKDENDQIINIDDVDINLRNNSSSYMADLTLSENKDNVELEYYSPLYPNVEAVETGNINEHRLNLVSRVYPDYKYQWRHESMGRTVLSGFSNGVFSYEENGIAEGPSVVVNGAGKYILSIEKNGVITDVASTVVKHETMTWNQAMAKLQELGEDNWIIPNRNQMAELYNGGINDFYYDNSTEKYLAECYWTCEEANDSWAYTYYFNPYFANDPFNAPERTTNHAVRFIKKFLYDPNNPFSVEIMPSPEPYSGELKLYITTPPFNGATYQWSNEKTGRKQLSVDENGKITYEENSIPEGPEVYVTGAGKYILSVTYGGETKVVGSVNVEHEKLCWNDVQKRLDKLNKDADAYEWKVPHSLESLRQMYNNGDNDCLPGWYWSDEFTNTANRWKYLKDMGNGVEDAGDIIDDSKVYYIRFIKQSVK